MVDPIYNDPRLAPAYDAFEPERLDLDAYIALAHEFDAHRIVDLGCGTGCLALKLTSSNRRITAVDPAGASLDVARSKPGADQITWIEGDAAAIPSDLSADLIVMPGNAAQAILTDHAWNAMLHHVWGALTAGGLFVFESRRPEQRAWEGWTHPDPQTAEVPGIGTVARQLTLTAVNLPLVSFRYTYRFQADGASVVSDSTIRFRGRDEIEASLRTKNFSVRDVRDAPDRPACEFVFIVARSEVRRQPLEFV